MGTSTRKPFQSTWLYIFLSTVAILGMFFLAVRMDLLAITSVSMAALGTALTVLTLVGAIVSIYRHKSTPKPALVSPPTQPSSCMHDPCMVSHCLDQATIKRHIATEFAQLLQVVRAVGHGASNAKQRATLRSLVKDFNSEGSQRRLCLNLVTCHGDAVIASVAIDKFDLGRPALDAALPVQWQTLVSQLLTRLPSFDISRRITNTAILAESIAIFGPVNALYGQATREAMAHLMKQGYTPAPEEAVASQRSPTMVLTDDGVYLAITDRQFMQHPDGQKYASELHVTVCVGRFVHGAVGRRFIAAGEVLHASHTLRAYQGPATAYQHAMALKDTPQDLAQAVLRQEKDASASVSRRTHLGEGDGLGMS